MCDYILDSGKITGYDAQALLWVQASVGELYDYWIKQKTYPSAFVAQVYQLFCVSREGIAWLNKKEQEHDQMMADLAAFGI